MGRAIICAFRPPQRGLKALSALLVLLASLAVSAMSQSTTGVSTLCIAVSRVKLVGPKGEVEYKGPVDVMLFYNLPGGITLEECKHLPSWRLTLRPG